MNTIAGINQQPNIRFNSNLTINKKRNVYNYNYGHSNISFGSRKSEMLIGLLDNEIGELVNNGSALNVAGRMKFKKVLQESLPYVMSPNNFINKGRDSKVYRINDNYVAKIRRGHYEDDSVKSYNIVTLPSQKFKSLDFYYGEPIVKVGDVEILKNATPTENNICCGTNYKGISLVSKEEMKKYTEVYLPMCSSLPQESFDNFADNLKRLNGISSLGLHGRKYYTPDVINPNNLIISDGKFKLVDELDEVHCKEPNSFYTMVEPLLVRLTPEHNAEYDEKLIGMRQTIFNKCLKAAEKTDLPMSSRLRYQYSDYVLQKILQKQ